MIMDTATDPPASSSVSTSTSASGPRACRPCAESKAKCVWSAESSALNGKCRRCNRLNKDCILQTPAPRRRKPQRQTRVSQLEERLEGLVERLNSTQTQQAFSDDAAATNAYISPDSFVPHEPHPHVPVPSSLQYIPELMAPELPAVPNGNSIILGDPERLLETFRDRMSINFPFVVIPPGMTAHDLGLSKPFLLKVILMVASFQDIVAQERVSEEIVEYLSLHAFLKAEKSLDLLQGLLIFIAWYHVHVHIGRRLILLLNLAVAQVVELGLNRELHAAHNPVQSRTGFKLYGTEASAEERRTLEERRAFLGVVYLASVISISAKYIEPLQYTDYKNSCVSILTESAQYRSDAHLVALLELQSMAEEISQIVPRETLEFSPLTAPIAMLLKSMQAKLTAFQNNLSSELKQSPSLVMHYHSILLYLTETALYIPLPSRPTTLNACLSSCAAFLSSLFSVPIVTYYRFTYPTWLQLSYTLTVLQKLSQFENEAWDLRHVQSVLDLSLVLDGLVNKFMEIRQVREAGNVEFTDRGVLTEAIGKFQAFREGFERKREGILRRLRERESESVGSGSSIGTPGSAGALSGGGGFGSASHRSPSSTSLTGLSSSGYGGSAHVNLNVRRVPERVEGVVVQGSSDREFMDLGGNDGQEMFLSQLDEEFWQEIMGDLGSGLA